MNKAKLAITVAIGLLLALGVYAMLGGFNRIDISVEDRSDINLVGLTYRGTPQDEGMVETFRRVESLAHKFPEANIHTIYHTEPAGKLDTLQVFVGIEQGDLADLPEDFEVNTIRCDRVLVAEINSHKWVMPTPAAVKESLEAFAREEGLILQDVFVDKIIDRNQVKVLAPLEN